MRIASISNTRNNKQTFKAHIEIKRNVEPYLGGYFQEFSRAIESLRRNPEGNDIYVSTLTETLTHTIFNIETNGKRYRVPIPKTLSDEGKSIELLRNVFGVMGK